MKRITASDEYRVSQRVVVKAGDTFRAKGGPYYVTLDSAGRKSRTSMAARGPFRFVRHCIAGRQEWIEATSKRDGGTVILALTRRRSVLPGSLIARPYRIVGLVRGPRRRKGGLGRGGRGLEHPRKTGGFSWVKKTFPPIDAAD